MSLENSNHKDVEELAEIEKLGNDRDAHIFVSASGRRIPTKKFSPMYLEKVRNSVDMPAVPTYEVKTITGGVEIFEHKEDTLEVEGDEAQTQENIKIWEEYQENRKEAEAEIVRKILNLVLLKGVDVNLPDDDSWMEEQELIGIEIPKDNRTKLRLHYIETEVLEDTDDLGNLMTFVMERIGVRREVIQEAEESFQDNVQRETPEGDDVASEEGQRIELRDGRRYQIIESRVELQ